MILHINLQSIYEIYRIYLMNLVKNNDKNL